jgi:hypothetical protein
VDDGCRHAAALLAVAAVKNDIKHVLRMGKVSGFSFGNYLHKHKIKSIFHQCDGDRTFLNYQPVVYCSRADAKIEEQYNDQEPQCSDLKEINAKRFAWFDRFLPKIQALQHEDDPLYWQRVGPNGYVLNLYSVDSPELVSELIENIFDLNPSVLDAAIRMCDLSLTTKHWSNYLQEHQQWLAKLKADAAEEATQAQATQRCATILRQAHIVPDNLSNAWGTTFHNRHIELLDEQAIEVILYEAHGHVPNTFWHVLDDKTNFSAVWTGVKSKGQYGLAHILLPGPDLGYDRVAIEVSGRDGIFPAVPHSTNFDIKLPEKEERLEKGVFLPSNVMFRDGAYNGSHCSKAIFNKRIYIIELCANGMPSVYGNGWGREYNSDVLKTIRIPLSRLQAMQQGLGASVNASRDVDDSGRAAGGMSFRSNNIYTIN